MSTYSFLDDYSEGCHPRILEALANSNMDQQTAYGEDEYSRKARELIQAQLGNQNAEIFFVAGGTLANIIIMASCLRSHEAVIASNIGHINVHETGAIEATGHKIIVMPSTEGKLTPADVQSALDNNAHFPHMAKPRLVYITNASEVGTLYSKAELTALSTICKANNLLLMVDGARLGAALSAQKNDLTLGDIAELTDIFWIGGTKAGAMLGEAIVISNPVLADDFSFHIKQRGALLAKGRLLGLQFLELFKDGLYFEATSYANKMAGKLSTAITENGHTLAAETQTNQIFPILPNGLIDRLKESFSFYVWEKLDDERSTIRLVTSWATEEKQVDAFIRVVEEFS
ncbi:MAG: aminotransferase class I/II-fold pyridoxal phosphate-dependent enzyme [Gammaproteobacteria bacterium]|nr:aminotransferase class I/II-fold pyridoxal phosphate-dependent enzyme [Gammaproteobacteria bacterium]